VILVELGWVAVLRGNNLTRGGGDEESLSGEEDAL
jgi:hypothetical protein